MQYRLALTILLPISLGTELIASEAVYSAPRLLTPRQLVSKVLLANPKMAIAQATWQASIAKIDQQSSFEDPLFSYNMAPQTVGNDRTDFGQRIEISQKLPWPGKLQLRNEQASYQAAADNQSIHSLRLKLSVAAKVLFADWYYSHQVIQINQQNQHLLAEFKAIAISRYSTGLASKQDALRAEMELALLEHQAISLKREQRTIATRINTLLNQPPEYPVAPPANLEAIPALQKISLLQEQALHARPELKALSALQKAAKSQSALAVRNNYPDINIKAGYNSLWENSSKHFTVGVGFNLPLFQAKYRAAEQQALAEIKQGKSGGVLY